MMEKIGDAKLKTPIFECLSWFVECLGPQFVLANVYKVRKEQITVERKRQKKKKSKQNK
jgi:hypothetical protein